MNSVVEKLAAIEKEVAALQPKMTPLTERIAALDQKVTGFAQQLTDLAAESAAVKQDIELTGQSLARIQTLIGESKLDSEQLATEQKESQQRYQAMESFVGTLYQLHSQSVQIAQWLGLADQAKAAFPAPPSAPATLAAAALATPPIAELSEQPVFEPDPPMPADDKQESVAEAMPEEPPVEKLPELPACEPDLPTPEALAEAMSEELPVEEPPAAESVLSESDFDSAMSELVETEPGPWAGMPNLPDVAAPPEMEVFPSASDTDMDTEPPCTELSDEMASQLDVPPLHLSVPALPEQNEPEAMNEQDEQEIEDMLATMMAPVTVGHETGEGN